MLSANEYEACRGADALVLATEWNEYRNPDLSRVKELLKGRCVFDGRNALVPEAVADAGLIYRGMGRPRLGVLMIPRSKQASMLGTHFGIARACVGAR